MVIPRRLTRALALCTGAALTVAGLAGCSADRSVEAYCQAVAQHKARYLSAMSQASSENALSALLDGGTAIADLKSMWDDLAAVAPSDIETDTNSVRDAWDKITDDANNQQWFAALAVSLENVRPMERVNAYIATHCGVNAAPVGAGVVQTGGREASTPTPTPTPDSTLATVDVSSPANDAWKYGPHGLLQTTSDGTFSTVGAQQGALTYGTITPTPTGTGSELRQSVGGVQQEADAAPDFVVATYSHQPASGLNPEKWLASVQLYNADGSSEGNPASVPACSIEDCTLTSTALFGSIAEVSISTDAGSSATTAIDIATGRVLWTAPNTVPVDEDGDLAVLDVSTSSGDSHGIEALDAATGTVAWALPDAVHVSMGYQRVAPDLAMIQTPGDGNDENVVKLNLVDLVSGSVRFSRYGTSGSGYAFDASTSRVVMTNVASTSAAVSNQQTQLETVDLSGKTLFSIPPSQYDALGNPNVIAATGGDLWIEGQNGLDAVDSVTGTQSPSSPQKTGSTDPIPLPTLIVDSIALVQIATGRTRYGPIALVAASGSPTSAEIAATTPASAN